MGQHRQPVPVEGHLDPGRLDDFDQAVDVVDGAVADAACRGDGLQPLLDRLLGMEADDAVADVRIARELADGNRIFFRLPQRIREVSERSGSGEDTAFLENPMKEAARHPAPLLSLALAIDHEVNRHI